MDWQPSAELDVLRKRAEIIGNIRQFFHSRNVMEVETPVLSRHAVTDIHLHSFHTEFVSPISPNAETLYLTTSPEFAMKRLLCAGSGPIFQLCKSFRNEEAGRYHNPEFTMLEWYRTGFDDRALMDEVDQFMQDIVFTAKAQRMSYQSAFQQFLGIDPLAISLDELKEVSSELGFVDIAKDENNPDTLLQLLFCEKIENQIGKKCPCFVYDFPASQAALAQIDVDNPKVARRFELYFQGIELANGFYELADAEEQLSRFTADNNQRQQLNLPEMPVDKDLIGALHNGLPDCAGVALGIDRLLMLALGKQKIADVMSFNVTKA